jgi:hypothetical protein
MFNRMKVAAETPVSKTYLNLFHKALAGVKCSMWKERQEFTNFPTESYSALPDPSSLQPCFYPPSIVTLRSWFHWSLKSWKIICTSWKYLFKLLIYACCNQLFSVFWIVQFDSTNEHKKLCRRAIKEISRLIQRHKIPLWHVQKNAEPL